MCTFLANLHTRMVETEVLVEETISTVLDQELEGVEARMAPSS